MLGKNSKALTVSARCEVSEHMSPGKREAGLSGASLHSGTDRYQGHKDPRTALLIRIRETAQTWVRYGYRKILAVLHPEGWGVGKTVVQRLYREEGLALRHRPKQQGRASEQRSERLRPMAANQAWSLGFVADRLVDGSHFRALTIVGAFTRDSLAIEVGQGLKGTDMEGVLSRLQFELIAPKIFSRSDAREA